MRAIEALVKGHYLVIGKEPLTLREICALYGRKWANNPIEVAIFDKYLIVCRDGVVRIRSLSLKWDLVYPSTDLR